MGVGESRIIDIVKESVSVPQNDLMFSKNLGHLPPIRTQHHSSFRVLC